MSEQLLARYRFEAFRRWHGRYGSIGHDYPRLLNNIRRRIDDCTTSPTPGHVQASDLDKSKFPSLGDSIFSIKDVGQIKAMFDESDNDRIGDDRSIHNALGSYALFLRLLFPCEWQSEPFWDGDESGPGGRYRFATFLTHGLDFRKEFLKRKLTWTMDRYLSAIRTKPFILLAGISGTGKSRLVRQLARGCCPDGHKLGKNAEGNANSAKKPGNFEMIPVRPNWHDSTELMGYVTRLTGDNKPKYVIKPFVKFLVKAAIWKDVPFFLCLDEMNLAPIEQYFAEYLSVVETRKKDGDDIVSDVLVNFDQPEIDVEKTVQELMADWIDVTKNEEGEIVVTEKAEFPGAKVVYDSIVADKGVRIPKNFIVMGTVNMDETTCSFSRKVLDRAMTFELNEVNMDEGLKEDNSIPYGSIPVDQALATAVEGCDFYSANKDVCDLVKTYLEDVNEQLDNTPFKFAYRSRNEIMLYCIERCKDGIVDLAQALDEATSMKVLSRIEGDAQKLEYVGEVADFKNMNILQVLQQVIPAALKKVNEDTEPVNCSRCLDKLKFMERRLNSGFTNFFV